MEIKVPAGTSFPDFHQKKKKQPKNTNNKKKKNGELSVIFFENLLQLSLSSQ